MRWKHEQPISRLGYIFMFPGNLTTPENPHKSVEETWNILGLVDKDNNTK